MKIYNYIIVVLIIGLSIFLVIQYNSIQDLSAKIDNWNNAITQVTICNDHVIEQISKQASKEDFYLTQLSNSTTLVLTVIGFALVVAGVFSVYSLNEKSKVIEVGLTSIQKQFESTINSKMVTLDTLNSTFKEEISMLVSEYKDTAEKSKEENDKNTHNLEKLKSQLDSELCLIRFSDCDKSLEENELNHAVYFLLRGLVHQSNYAIFAKNNYSKKYYSRTIEGIFNFIEIYMTKIKSHKKFKKDGKILIDEEDSYISMINDINRIDDTKIFKLLNELFSYLEVEESMTES